MPNLLNGPFFTKKECRMANIENGLVMLKIVGGPSIDSLTKSLSRNSLRDWETHFICNPFFTVTGGGKLRMTIEGMEREDGSGFCYLLKGRVLDLTHDVGALGLSADQTINSFFYSARTRQGHLSFVPKK
jgi:hypothetical protein